MFIPVESGLNLRVGYDRKHRDANQSCCDRESIGQHEYQWIYPANRRTWSPSLEPQYELPVKTKNLLQQMIATRLEQLIQTRI
jgi:hypothetical protein